MLKSQKHVFWMALVSAIIVFIIGISIGMVIENRRVNKVDYFYANSELELLDIKTWDQLLDLEDINCEKAIEENINFADRIYEESKILDRFEKASKLSDSLILRHKKYDLLRTLFWINAIKIKKVCDADYHNVVYIYDYLDPSLDTKAKQSVFSKLLGEVKDNKGSEVMLIHFAGDLELSSIRLLMSLYNVTEEELPVILIDEEIKITELRTTKQIEELL